MMSLVSYGGGTGKLLPKNCLVLTSEKYTMWAIKVEANLDAVGPWEAVVPAKDSMAAVVHKKDKPTRAYLLGVISEEILLQVSLKKTAAELWASLRMRFVGGGPGLGGTGGYTS
ncbi:retrotransposon protein [Hordeum vulgare]|nr:retrotransposon protein [Hordeum vulgare]